MDPAAALAYWLILHRPDGGEVAVSARHITSLHSEKPAGTKMYHPDLHCIVGLDDGKWISVTETCAVVRKMLRDQSSGR